MSQRIFTSFVALSLLVLPAFAGAEAPLFFDGAAIGAPAQSRDAFYCQDPEYTMIYNISSGFDAEFADDIPAELAGNIVNTVTIWLGEWFSMGGPLWTDPVGVRVNFYNESCPPELEPARIVEVAWDDLDKTLVYDTPGITVYELRVPLDPPLTLEAGMSLGATALIDWGQEEPFTGIVATPFYVSYGACPAYLDAGFWGYDRWTAIDFYTQIPQDLAYCLGNGAVASESRTWSLLKSYYR